jgi:glycosyltransferase involved in cell wall biosynthesis
MSTTSEPLKVSCVMVTANRKALCRRAVLCFERQTYPTRELVVIDDGEQDLADVLCRLGAGQVIYRKIPPSADNVLGRLRNIALEIATGAVIAQWDDDDWYHPERLAKQVAALEEGYDACCLSATLMHLDNARFADHPYIGLLKDGVPGSIVHRRSGRIRYAEERRGEDTLYLRQWWMARYTQLPRADAGLFIRCFHGGNTWEERHFRTRLRNTLPDLLEYIWYWHIRREPFRHSRFQLSEAQQQAFAMYLDDSRALGLM